MRKYKLEKLVVLYIYRYDANSDKMKLCNFKVTTQRKIKNIHFGHNDYVKALDGVSYPTDYPYSDFCALKVESLLSFLDIDKVKDIKKVSYRDIVLVEKEICKQRFSPKEELIEAKDLF